MGEHFQLSTQPSHCGSPDSQFADKLVTMGILTASVSLLLAATTLCSIVAMCDSNPVVQGLRLKSYSEDEIKGCYIYNQTFGACFDVKKGFIKITKTTGEETVLYLQLGQDMFFFRALGQSFVANGPLLVYVPDDVSKHPEALRVFLEHIRSNNGIEQREALRIHYHEAMSGLHNAPEVKLLELVSAALADNSTRLEILQPFHFLCFNLLKASEVEIPSELKAASDMEDETTEEHHRDKRCSRPRSNNCFGMCGKGCSCWRWVCGDCCWHRGCYEHDRCCDHKFISTYCLTPIGFSCSGFRGYPRCLHSFWPWK